MIDSHGLWAASAPAAPATTPLSGMSRVDVAIVGGGYTGLSAALHLAEGGASVAVLEGEEIGSGGSGRNVGLVNAGMWVKPDDLPGVLGPVHGDRLLQCLGDGPRLVFDIVARHGLDCEARHTGTLHCAVGPKGLAEIEERCAQWQKRGAPVRVLSAEEAARRIGTTAYAGALLDERAGTIQPLAYARGLASAALKAGAAIHTHSRVTACDRGDQRWQLTTAGGGRVEADWVIVATNAYTSAPWPQVRAEIVHLPYFNFATVPLSAEQRAVVLPGGEGCWNTRDVLTSFRMDAAGRLVLGSVGALRGTGTAIHGAWARRTLKRLFPMLAGVPFEQSWFGWIGMTADALPRFHRFGPQAVGFSGYNGRGIAPGTVFGRLLAEHVLGRVAEQDLPLPVTEPAPHPWRPVHEAVYEYGSQAVHLTGIGS